MRDQSLTFQDRRSPSRFSPGWVSTLCTVLIIPGFVYLGFWQLNRAEEKKKIQNALETRIKLPALEFSDLPIGAPAKQELLESLRYRQLKVHGTFLNDKQILLDNQIVDGKVGYRVFTPLVVQKKRPDEKSEILLIDRGWIPIGQSRNILPSIVPIQGTVSLKGTLNQPSYGLVLKGKTEIEWPLRVQRIDFKTLSEQLGQELIPLLVQLNTDDVYGFEIPHHSFNISIERHLGYAVQWFTLALAVLIYYWVINRRPQKYAERYKK